MFLKNYIFEDYYINQVKILDMTMVNNLIQILTLFLSIYYILISINSELKLVNYYKKLNYNEHYKYS